MGERDDELLPDIPEGAPLGGFAGYRAGLRTRRLLYGAVITAVLSGVAVGIWYARTMETRYRTPAWQRYELAEPRAEAAASRPGELHWSSGRARLGLSRGEPGVSRLVLPDRVITLAEGCDHAQVKVDVRDGVTVSVDVIVGEIEELPREGQAPPPDRPATAHTP